MTHELFAGLFVDEVAVELADPRAANDPALPEEEALIVRAIDKRVREVRASRHAVRRALARLGLPAAAIGHDSERAPVWPAGVVGSISHTRDLCAVAVARRGHVTSVGLDVERAEALSDALVARVCTPCEIAALARHGDVARLAKIVFSAKEAFYKAQHPLTRRFLGFQDVELELELELEPGNGRFVVILNVDAPPLLRGHRVAGLVRTTATHVATAVTYFEPSVQSG